MANRKMSELAAILANALADGDLIPIVDVSAGETKVLTKAQFATLFDAAGAAAAAQAASQPLDSDLTAIAALSTTSFGRSLLGLADAAAARAALGAETSGAAAAAQAASQPLDSDLTAIAALTTTTYGRSLLTLASVSALATSLATDSAFSSRFASKVRTDPRFTIAIGDSMIAGADSWWQMLCAATGQRMTMLYNAGIGGQTSTQMLARIATDVIARAPGSCVINPVTPNDTTAAIPLVTRKANTVAMVDACVAAGIRPILSTSCPHDTAQGRTDMSAMNAWLQGYCDANAYAILDCYTPLADPADSTFAAAYTDDGGHPNAAGKEVLVTALTPIINSLFPVVPTLLTPGASDGGNLLANGVFVGDTNADGIANSWSLAGTASAKSLVAMSTDGQGNWQRVSIAGTLAYVDQQISSGFSVGDVIEFSGKWKTDLATANTNIAVLWFGPNTFSGYQLHPTTTARTFTFRATVPAGTTSIYVRPTIQVGTGYLQVGQMTARNLTALGAI